MHLSAGADARGGVYEKVLRWPKIDHVVYRRCCVGQLVHGRAEADVVKEHAGRVELRRVELILDLNPLRGAVAAGRFSNSTW